MAALTRALPPVLLMLIVLCTGVELVLVLSDLNVLVPARLRALAYDYGGFWPGLLDNWRPNFASQPYVMFISYGFLHGGLAHLILNMVALWWLGNIVIGRVGVTGFVLLYLGALMGGAVGYALLGPDLRPMVGASGAVFGLIGGALAWLYVDRYTYNEGLLPVAQAVVMLIVLNVVQWWAMNGQLAWQTHLGGFVAGWVAAMLIDPRPTPPEDEVSFQEPGA